ncbi:MAG: FAD-dependent oxidoreductase [Chitinophagaceae bacterium]|nr:FAD-dependent oxidoreductase [Chitinophagaceae bacterium]
MASTGSHNRGTGILSPAALLYYGPAADPIMQGVKAAHDFKIPLQAVADQALSLSFVEKEGNEAWLEPAAGYLLPEKAIRLFLNEAAKAAAVLHTGEKIISWKKRGEGIEVLTTKQTYYSKRLVITAGPWAAQLIRELSVPLIVTRQIILWVETDQLQQYQPFRFSLLAHRCRRKKGAWYGFPSLDTSICPGPQGLKTGPFIILVQTPTHGYIVKPNYC